jgi:hypothetical protein
MTSKREGYGMSLGEVKNIYLQDELDVHPSFQRFFRWSPQQKSNLIESFMLGIPVPPIFVSQRDDGVWDVVDGVQRLSTVLEFMGVLKAPDGATVPPKPLVGAEYLKTLEGVVFDADAAGLAGVDESNALSDVLRRDFTRAKIEFRIIHKTSDPQAKFDLFQRLNSGTRLTEQESRNSLAVMLDPSLYEWLDGLSSNRAFLDTVLISDAKIVSQYNVELVIRFLAGLVRRDDLASIRDVASFLDDTVRMLAERTATERVELAQVFDRTFALLDATVGESVFRRWSGTKHTGGFNLGAFEALGIGLAHHIDDWDQAGPTAASAEILAVSQSLWTDPVFIERSGSGKPGSYRMPALVERGIELFVR